MICKRFLKLTSGATGLALLSLAISAAHAQAPSQLTPLQPKVAAKSASSPSTPITEAHPLTAEDVGAFLDGIVPMQLKRENIAGAVVIVVKDGSVLFAKGYGYADVERGTPVTPDGTLFRPGSVSKLFTWTAIMQMVEQGKLDLDRDINDYLDFKIPATFPKPITTRNLLTHTTGFEEAVKDLIVTKNSAPMSLRDYLTTHMPKRVYAPGTTPAYSNYGATLAGYIVERLSGMPFDDYVEKNIFGPLDMPHSTFRQPLPASLVPMMSSGYTLATEKAKPYEIIRAEPAGSSASSAVDMSHFMLAHLQAGSYHGVQILKPQTVELMHSRQFGVNPALPGMAMGFYEETRNGHRIIGHAGDTQYFHSDLHLIQDASLGLFVSYNSAGRGEISPRTALFTAFLDRYFPYPIPPATKPADARRDAEMVAGQYITSRRPVTNLLSFIGFLGDLRVSAGKDGSITIDGFKNIDQVPKTWQEIGPLLYREKNGQDLVGFTRDSDNRLVLAMDYPFMVWTKVSLADTKPFNLFLFGFVSIVCLATLLAWPISAWIRYHYRRPLAWSQSMRWLRVVIRVVLLVDIIFIIAWVALLAASGGEPLFDASLDPKLRLMQLIGWLGSLGTTAILYAVARTWRGPGEWWLSRAGNIVIALAAVAFSWFLLHWHLLHLSLNY